MMMLPVALAGMFAKPLATRLITRAGYRHVLVVNTTLVGLAMASFALTTPEQPPWLRIAQLAGFGAVNSLQFTAMNTITLKDLEGGLASSGNRLLSMVQMLSMSMGVAAASAVLAGYSAYFSPAGQGQTLAAFHATFVTMGLITVASAGIFWQLSPELKVAGERREPGDAA